MSNNDNFKFPWLDQLQEFYDNSAKIIEDSANNLLKFDPINTHNPSDLKRMDTTKIHPHKKTKNEIKETSLVPDDGGSARNPNTWALALPPVL